MQHPDEGTIHAWLDGALDETESARIAEHVAACPACEARVVEARGFIAGASRVLSALDAVPAGVIPAARDAAPDDTTPAPSERTRHWWRRRGVSPALAAAATVAFLAVGSSLVVRERRRPMDEMASVTVRDESLPARDSAAPQAAAASSSDARVTGAPTPMKTVTAPASAAAPDVAAKPSSARTEQANATAPGSAQARMSPAPSVAPTVVPPHRETETRQRVAANAPAMERGAAPVPPSSGFAAGARASGNAAAGLSPAAAPRPLAPQPAAAEAPLRAATADVAERKAAPSAASDSLGAMRLRVAQNGSLAGCYEIVEGDPLFVPRRFVLDTTPAPPPAIGGNRAGDLARPPMAQRYAARSASGPVTAGSWSVLGPIARVVWQGTDTTAVLQLRAGTAARFEATLTVNGVARTIVLRRCAQ